MAGKYLLAFTGAVLLCCRLVAADPPLEITAELQPYPPDYQGRCPARILFRGYIAVNAPARVQYRLVRSDGGASEVETLSFFSAGRREVSGSWEVAASFQGWMAIEVVYPQEIDFKRADFSVDCHDKPEPHKPMPFGNVEPEPLPMVVENCVWFDPDTAHLKLVGQSWRIANDSQSILDFGYRKDLAERALAVIRYYSMNQACSVGEPKPTFHYMLANGNAPAGYLTGEDCVAFSPDSAKLVNAEGNWRIEDRGMTLYSFGVDQADGRVALAIIKKYGFSRSCFVGRPSPVFRYLRK